MLCSSRLFSGPALPLLPAGERVHAGVDSWERSFSNKHVFLVGFSMTFQGRGRQGSVGEAGRDLWVQEHFASAYTAVTAPLVSSVWASPTGLFTTKMQIYVPERTPSEEQRAELLLQKH